MDLKIFIVLIVTCVSFSCCQQVLEYQILARDIHNSNRSIHISPPLQLDDSLNSIALQCARYYTSIQKRDHSCPFKNESLGENLVGDRGFWSDMFSASYGSRMWYNEISDYDFSNPGWSTKTGHFTQLIWQSTALLGFGVASSNSYTIGVAIYYPRGNQVDDANRAFIENVLPPSIIMSKITF